MSRTIQRKNPRNTALEAYVATHYHYVCFDTDKNEYLHMSGAGFTHNRGHAWRGTKNQLECLVSRSTSVMAVRIKRCVLLSPKDKESHISLQTANMTPEDL